MCKQFGAKVWRQGRSSREIRVSWIGGGQVGRQVGMQAAMQAASQMARVGSKVGGRRGSNG